MGNKKTKQTYKYIKEKSFIVDRDGYCMSEGEYCQIYSFFVTYSMCSSQSVRGRSFEDYGWARGLNNKELVVRLKKVLNIDSILFEASEEKSLAALFEEHQLGDGPDALQLRAPFERAVIGKTNENNKYFKLFHHIRNGLAHGSYRLVISDDNEKMIAIQDQDRYNVTARMIIKMESLLGMIKTIDLKGLI